MKIRRINVRALLARIDRALGLAYLRTLLRAYFGLDMADWRRAAAGAVYSRLK